MAEHTYIVWHERRIEAHFIHVFIGCVRCRGLTPTILPAAKHDVNPKHDGFYPIFIAIM